MSRFDNLQVQIAEAQLRTMKELEAHATKLRALELKKAETELDTAQRLNLLAVRLGDDQNLPPIKLS